MHCPYVIEIQGRSECGIIRALNALEALPSQA